MAQENNRAMTANLTFRTVENSEPLFDMAMQIFKADAEKKSLSIPEYNKRTFSLMAKTADGQIAGGLVGYTNWNECHCSLLATNPNCKVRGTGTALMQHVEKLAHETLGCDRLGLMTFSWQARPFYEKLGFHLFGVVEDHPKGHKKYFMEKRLSREAPPAEATSQTVKDNALVTVTPWDLKEAEECLYKWLDEDTQSRKIDGVPHYVLTSTSMEVLGPDGSIVSVCLFDSVWNELHVRILAVNPEKQLGGVGSAVLAHLEELGRQRGCKYITLETMSWQARPFYEKNGFKVFATQEDIPHGFSRYFLLRELPEQ